MTPRKIDALVAEKVMGWKVHGRNTAYYVPAEYQSMLMPDTAVMVDEFKPSKSIECAWLVIEKMKKRGHHVSIQNCHAHDADWCAVFADKNDAYEGCGSAPLAICLAALKAVGVEVK